MKLQYLTDNRIMIAGNYINCYDTLRCLRAKRGQAEAALIVMVMKMVEQEKEKWLDLIKQDPELTDETTTQLSSS